MKLPQKPEDVHALLENAYNTKNADVVMSLYDASGVIVPEPGKPVSGKDQFEQAVKGILSIPGEMTIKTVYCLQAGNIAVGRSEWSIAEGGHVKVSAKGVEVMKQQPDGTWKIVIDHAFGADGNLVAS